MKGLVAAALLMILPAAAHAQSRFLALGDSYTVGTAVTDKQRWPQELARLLAESGLPVDAPVIVAENGWSTADLSAALQANPPQGAFDLVTLMIGVNNEFRGMPIDGYRKDLARLLADAKGWAKGDARRVVVLSIPDWGVMPFAKGRDRKAIAADIDKFNAALRDETRKAGARWVDVTFTSRAAATNPELVGDDGLHPSWKLHAVWARLAFPVCRAVLDRPK